MTFRRTLVLWALVLGLGLYVWSTSRRTAPVEGQPAAAIPADGPPIVSLRSAAVNLLEIGAGPRIIRLERRGGTWRDTAGKEWRRVKLLEDLIDVLTELRPLTQVAPVAAPLGEYGLDPAARWVAVSIAGEAPVRIDLGQSNPAGTAIYARRVAPQDSGVLLIGSIVAWEIDKVLRAAGGARH